VIKRLPRNGSVFNYCLRGIPGFASYPEVKQEIRKVMITPIKSASFKERPSYAADPAF